MQGLDPFEEEAGGTVFRDIIMLGLAGFVAIVVLLLPYINPPGAKTNEDSAPPGNVIVEIRWPDELDADVDLWVQAPGDVPVGYSNKGGAVFNLLRDDLGQRGDATGLNYETSYSRGILPGEYVANLHLFRNPSNTYPVPVTVVTSVKRDGSEPTRQLLASKVLLVREGEEVTAYRFQLRRTGDLVEGSVHSLQKDLRSLEAVMTGVTELFVAATILTGMLALISIWAPRRLLVKGLALSMAVMFIPVAYASFVNLLSRPKPVSLEWWLAEAREATVLGSSLREDDGIYLWLQLPDVSEPRSYVLPWDREIAEQLQRAEREAAGTQGGLKMRMPFEPSLDDRGPKFYALPQPAPPEKEEPAPGPQLYQAPGGRDA